MGLVSWKWCLKHCLSSIKGGHPLVNFGLDGQSHTEEMSQKLDTEICVIIGDLNRMSLKIKVQIRALQTVEDHNPSLT